MEGRLLRAQSLSTLAVRGRASSVDPLAGMSKEKDNEFRKAMLDRVTRVKRALSVRPDAGEIVRSHRQSHLSVSESRAPNAVFVPINSKQTSGLILPSGGSVEYWPTTVTDPGRLAVRYGSVQPEPTRRRFEKAHFYGESHHKVAQAWSVLNEITQFYRPPNTFYTRKGRAVPDAQTLPHAVTISRRRVLDEADDAAGRGNRISTLLEKLKVVDGHSRYQQDGNAELGNSHRTDRLEVDTFAAALGSLSLPTPVGLSLTEVRRRTVDSENTDPDDFSSRLIHAHGDLKRIEDLASKTFNWNDRSNKRREIFTETTRRDVNDREQAKFAAAHQSEMKFVEAKPVTKETMTFYGDRSIGIRRIDSAAEQAIQWAQQRRLALENDLSIEKQRERYGIHNMPTTISVLGLVNQQRPTSSRTRREEDHHDQEEHVSYHVPRRDLSRGPDRGPSIQSADRDFDLLIQQRPNRGHARSESALDRIGNVDYRLPRHFEHYEPPVRKNRLSGRDGPLPVKQQSGISDARRRIREVLVKSKGDPHYFDRRRRQPDDDDDY